MLQPADLLVMPPENGDLFAAVRQGLPPELIGEYEAFLADYLNFREIFSQSDAELAGLNQEFGQVVASFMQRIS